MNYDADVSTLRAELAELTRLSRRLNESLAHSAVRLEVDGALPPRELLDELLEFRTRVLSIHGLLCDRSPQPNTADVRPSLEGIERLLQRLETAERARMVLEALSNLSHVDGPDFAPLEAVQESVQRLSASLCAPDRDSCLESSDSSLDRELITILSPEVDAEIADLANGRHPLAALNMLIDPGEVLADDVWEELHDRVNSAYGRVLATAVMRGKIVRTSTSVSLAPRRVTAPAQCHESAALNPEPVDAIPLRPAIRMARPSAVTAAVARKLSDDSARGINQRVPLPVARRIDVADDSGRPSATELSVPTRKHHSSQVDAAPLDTPVARTARGAARASGREREALLAQLILDLVRADRLGVAWHVARCLEAHPRVAVSAVPTWLLRSLALSRHLVYPKGEIARLVEADFQHFRRDAFQTQNPEWNRALEFFLRAAVLPVSLIAPSTPVANICRTFEISPPLAQLYNYGSRVAAFGDRLLGLTPQFAPPSVDARSFDFERSNLQQEVTVWQTAAREILPYAKASPLFSHGHWSLTTTAAQRNPALARRWSVCQQTLVRAARLLEPVRQHRPQTRTWVRHEVASLTSQLQRMRDEGAENTLSSELEQVLFESIDIASRWLRLCESCGDAVMPFIPNEAEQLRVAALEQTDVVLVELHAFDKMHPAPAISAGIASCTRVVRHLHGVFSGETARPMRETDPRHVLHAELLKLPALRLKPDWEPDVSIQVLETELLEFLQCHPTDWRQAFDAHCRNGDHLATERILSLDVWPIEERNRLEKERSRQIEQCRDSLEQQIDEARSRVAASASQQLLSVHDEAALVARIDRLHNDAVNTPDFAQINLQLEQVRIELDKLDSRETPRKQGRVPPPSLPASVAAQQLEPLPVTTSEPETEWIFDAFTP